MSEKTVERFRGIGLVDPADEAKTVKTDDLFMDRRPAVVILLRDLVSPGSLRLIEMVAAERETIKETYGLNVVVVSLCKTGLDRFSSEVWKDGNVWLDPQTRLFTAFGDGNVRASRIRDLFRPRVWKHVFGAKTGKRGSFRVVLNSLFVVGRESPEILYTFQERVPGDTINVEELLACCCRVSMEKPIKDAGKPRGARSQKSVRAGTSTSSVVSGREKGRREGGQ